MNSSTTENSGKESYDWVIFVIYALIVVFGWLSIYAATQDTNQTGIILEKGSEPFKQLIWMGISAVMIFIMLLLDFKVYEISSYFIYGVCIVLLLAVFVFGREIKGAKAWIDLGFMSIQPSELAKVGICFAVARFLGDSGAKVTDKKTIAILLAFLILPAVLIKLQGETGSILVYGALILMLYREGLPSFLLVFGGSLIAFFIITLMLRESYIYEMLCTLLSLGTFLSGVLLFNSLPNTNIFYYLILFFSLLIPFFLPIEIEILFYVYATITLLTTVGAITFYIMNSKLKFRLRKAVTLLVLTSLSAVLVYSVDYIISDVLEPHQQNRIKTFINPSADPRGTGWQVTQSIVAIGSGGIDGKGYLKGTQTKYGFVPDQHTDFIFSTIGEERGWFGSVGVIVLYIALISRLLIMGERQKLRYSRVFIYSVASIFLFHFIVNIGMTIGLMPVIGIPLPFFSYGGSGFLSFTLLLFTAVKLDSHRLQLLSRGE